MEFGESNQVEYMKLDKHINHDGVGKYTLIGMRRIKELSPGERSDAERCLQRLKELGCIPNYGFFVLGYNDAFSPVAMRAYSDELKTYAQAMSDAGNNILKSGGSTQIGMDCLQKAKELFEFANDIETELLLIDIHSDKAKLPD